MTKRISKGKGKLNRGATTKTPISRKSKTTGNSRSTASSRSTKNKQVSIGKKARGEKTYIVRIMGKGQYQISSATAKKLNELDNAIVEIMQKANDQEFKNRLEEMISLVTKEHRPLDVKEIMPSDFIIPSVSISSKEASEWFEGEGLIPENFR